MSRILTLSVAAALIGAAVGVGLVASWAVVGAPTQCVRSEPVATLLTLTPVMFVNSPYRGFGNETWTTYSNSSSARSWEKQTIGAKNGSTSYLLDRVNWTIWTTQRVGDPAGSCSGVFAFSQSPAGYPQDPTGTFSLNIGSPSSYTNDSQAPQSTGDGSVLNFTGGPYSPVYFNDSFYRDGPYFQDCDSGMSEWSEWPAYSTFLTYRIPFVFQGSTHIASISVSELTNYTCSFPRSAAGASTTYPGPAAPAGVCRSRTTDPAPRSPECPRALVGAPSGGGSSERGQSR